MRYLLITFLSFTIFFGFTLSVSAGNLISTLSTDYYDYDYELYNGSFEGFGYLITTPEDGNDNLGSIKWYLKKSGSPTGNGYAKVYANNAGALGSLLATSDALDVSTLGTSYDLIEFTFTGAEQVELSENTSYWLTFEYLDNGNSSNKVVMGCYNNAEPMAYYNTSWNYLSVRAFIYELYDNEEDEEPQTTASSTAQTYGDWLFMSQVQVFLLSFIGIGTLFSVFRQKR